MPNITVFLCNMKRRMSGAGRRSRQQRLVSTTPSTPPPPRISVMETKNCGGQRSYNFRRRMGQKIRFRVRASNDASICLTTAATETPCNMYEVFLGGWGGQDSAIRRNKTRDLCKVKTPDILSQDEFRGFWLVVTRGAIKVGKEGEATPFMFYNDPTKSLQATHYGYCTAWGATGSWTFSDSDPTFFELEVDSSDLVHETLNCGGKRSYEFRKMSGQKIRFRVRASNDASLCLTTAAAETPGDMYEVFLGGWRGRDSAIRRNKTHDVCKMKTPGILNQHEFRGFWLVVTKDAIMVGMENEESPFLTYSDPSESLRPTHYGYCTAWGSAGSWTFADEDPTYFGPELNVTKEAMAHQLDNPVPMTVAPKDEFCDEPPSYSVTPSNPSLEAPPSYSRYAYMPPKMPVKWVLCQSGAVCASPVPVAPGKGQPLVARAYHENALTPGVLHPRSNTCLIPWGCRTHHKEEYYLLSNPQGVLLEWVNANWGNVPTGAIQGGISEAGEPLYICRVKERGAYIPGKVHPSHSGCFVAIGEVEKSYFNYEVLCFTTVPLSMLGDN